MYPNNNLVERLSDECIDKLMRHIPNNTFFDAYNARVASRYADSKLSLRATAHDISFTLIKINKNAKPTRIYTITFDRGTCDVIAEDGFTYGILRSKLKEIALLYQLEVIKTKSLIVSIMGSILPPSNNFITYGSLGKGKSMGSMYQAYMYSRYASADIEMLGNYHKQIEESQSEYRMRKCLESACSPIKTLNIDSILHRFNIEPYKDLYDLAGLIQYHIREIRRKVI